MEEIAKVFATIIGLILTIYIAYVLISTFVSITPGFAIIGWGIYILIIIVVVVFVILLFRNLFDIF